MPFPPAFLLFRRLPGRGYGFAKPLALVLAGYFWWLLGHVPAVPNSPWTLAVLLLVGGGVSVCLAYRRRDALRQFLREEWKTILAAELVFLGFFFFWLAIVADVPQINHTEKPMDFAFFNAVLTAGSLPPEDPWLAGHSISYYYFGHLMLASVAKLTGIASPVSYNLAVATIPALLASGAFALVFSLVRLSGGSRSAATVFGLAAPALLMLIGNLEGGLELVHSLGWGDDGFWQWVGVKGLEGGGQGSFFPEQHWWWWRATRVIDTLAGGRSLDYTITEFPFFSFLLGDLHAHMMSLPFLVMFLGVGLNLFQTRGPLGLQWLRRHPLEAVLLALLLGALAFINTWDFPVFAVILGLIIFARAMGDPRDLDSDDDGPDDYGAPRASPVSAAVQTLAMLVPVTALGVVLFLPFYANFSSQASVALPVTGPGTRPFLFLAAIGFPVLLAAAFCLKQLSGVGRPSRADRPVVALAAGVCLAPLALWGIGLGLVAWVVGPETLGDLRAGNRLLLTGTLLGLAGAGRVLRPAAGAAGPLRFGGFCPPAYGVGPGVAGPGRPVLRAGLLRQPYEHGVQDLLSSLVAAHDSRGLRSLLFVVSPQNRQPVRRHRPNERRRDWRGAFWQCRYTIRWGRLWTAPASAAPVTRSPARPWTAWLSCIPAIRGSTRPSPGSGKKRRPVDW